MKTESHIVPLTFALVVVVTMLFSQCRAHAEPIPININTSVITNASGGTTTITGVSQEGTIAGLFGIGSTNSGNTFTSIYKGAGDALAFVEGNTNGWARVTLEGGYLRTFKRWGK